MKKTAAIKLIIATPIFMLLANYMAVFAQEYAHSITAWLLGYKDHPLAIQYGGTSLLNLLLLFNINENVDYDLIISAGRIRDLAWVAMAGLFAANGGLYYLSLRLMRFRSVQHFHLLFYFLFWFNFMNFAQIFAYVPVRVFSADGDIANIVQGLNVSPWWILLIAGYTITYIIWHFFTRTLTRAYDVLSIRSSFFKAILMMLCAIPLFGYFGIAGFIDNGEIAHFLSAASLFILPGVIAACWPMPKEIASQLDLPIQKKIKVMKKNIAEAITHTITDTITPEHPPITEELALPHLSIDEAHFIENLNAVLGERDAKIRESQKLLKNKLTKKGK